METFENKSQLGQEPFATAEEEASGIKQKLGQLGRRIKRVDVRSQIVAHPFAAVGIAAGVGALVGLARPMPRRGPISGALMAVMSAIGFRVLREAAMIQLAQVAKDTFANRGAATKGMSAQAPQAGVGGY